MSNKNNCYIIKPEKETTQLYNMTIVRINVNL